MITVPLIYNAATRELSTTAEWIGYTIDNLSVRFSIEGIPEGYRAKLEYDVTINDSRGNQIHPYDHINIANGVGYVNLKAVVLRACRRDCILPVQMILADRTTGETITSTQVRFDISPAIAAYDSQQSTVPFIDTTVAKIREAEIGEIEVTQINGHTYNVQTGVKDFSDIQNVPIVTQWSENPSDANIPSEKLVKDTFLQFKAELDKKTPMTKAIPDWNSEDEYERGSAIIYNYQIYISLQDRNVGHDPTEEDTPWWAPVRGGGGGGHESEEHEIGDGMSTYIEVEHGLNTVQILWNLRIKDTGEYVDTKVEVKDESHVALFFITPPAEKSLILLLAPADGGSSGDATWGSIGGNIERQLDLKAKLDPLAINYVGDDDPVLSTPGKVGDIYVNKNSGDAFALTETTDRGNIWMKIGGNIVMDETVTADSENAVRSRGIYQYAQPRITIGMEDPTDDMGNDGDVYFRRGSK